MTAVGSNFGAGGGQLHPNHGSPDLATTLREIADDLAESLAGKNPAWKTGISVSSDQATFEGTVIAVESTTGTTTGPFNIVNGSPSSGQVQLSQSGTTCTLTFASGDAVTECAVWGISKTSGYTRKTTKA